MTEPKGKYVKKGDVEEWEWDKESLDVRYPVLTGGWVVPEGEFDPRSAPPLEPSPSEKLAEAAQSQGLRVAEEAEPEPEKKAAPKKVTTTTAKPLTGKK